MDTLDKLVMLGFLTFMIIMLGKALKINQEKMNKAMDMEQEKINLLRKIAGEETTYNDEYKAMDNCKAWEANEKNKEKIRKKVGA